MHNQLPRVAKVHIPRIGSMFPVTIGLSIKYYKMPITNVNI